MKCGAGCQTLLTTFAFSMCEHRQSWSCWGRSWRRVRKKDTSLNSLSIGLKQRYATITSTFYWWMI